MGNDQQKLPVPGRGFVVIDQFCLSAGLDQSTIRSLFETGCLEGLVDGEGRVVGIFDDSLPTADELRAMGLSVGSQYRPEHLRSYEDDGGDEVEVDPGDSAGATWTMTW